MNNDFWRNIRPFKKGDKVRIQYDTNYSALIYNLSFSIPLLVVDHLLNADLCASIYRVRSLIDNKLYEIPTKELVLLRDCPEYLRISQ